MTEPVFDRAKLADLHELEALTGTPLVRALLTTYLDGLDGLVQRIKGAVTSGDAAAQRMNAHSLKSSSAQLGLARVASVCFQLEHASSDGAIRLLADLDREVARARPVVQAERDAAS